MKRSATLLVAMSTPLALLGAPAQAAPGERDVRPCVTPAEFRQVAKGMSKLRVHDIFDTPGRSLFANRGQVSNEAREYVVCGHPRSGGSFVQVQFDNYALGGGPLRVGSKQLFVS